jgi:hypothetical protein
VREDGGASSDVTAASNRERLRATGVDLGSLRWFLSMAPESALDQLPADALFLPGQRTRFRDTAIDLATGRPIYLQETVPAGAVYCLLAPLKPLMRTEAPPKASTN